MEIILQKCSTSLENSCLNWTVPRNQTDQNDRKVGLLNMPDLVMREILTKCDLPSILNLMRVCRALHYYIHHSAPVARARILKVVVDNDAVYIRFEYNQPDHYCLYAVKFIMLSFHYHKNGCLIVSADDTEKYVKGKDFLSVACDHLRRYLRWVGTVPQFEIKHENDWYGYEPEFLFWEKLNIKLFSFMKPSFQLPAFEEIRKKVWETIEESLQSRVRPLRVTEFIMNIEQPRIHILNLLNPKPLRTLIIGGSGRCPEFNVRRLKNLEEISISKLGNYEERCVSQPIRDLFHIKFVSLTVETISDDEILEIKRELMICDRLQWMLIDVTQGELCPDQLLRLFGPPQHPWNPKNYCFPINTKMDMLFVRFPVVV